jgi:hypothetical protein
VKIPYLNFRHWLRHKLGTYTGEIKVWTRRNDPDVMMVGYKCSECGVMTGISPTARSLKHIKRKIHNRGRDA